MPISGPDRPARIVCIFKDKNTGGTLYEKYAGNQLPKMQL